MGLMETVLVRRIDLRYGGDAVGLTALIDNRFDANVDVSEVVRGIIADVRRRGDTALVELTAKFDRFETNPDGLMIFPEQIAVAIEACQPESLAALDLAAERIKAFHERQRPMDDDTIDSLGVRSGLRWQAIAAVGLYVPGGTAAYPSSVLMNAIPAKVAGCERLVMVAPTPDGAINPLVLAAAAKAGVTEIYRIGGAQAVAALAFGTSTINAVDKVVGPGNAFVAEAKRQVFGRIGIDMIAGPSEILVVADRSANARWVAADLLSQAEHDPSAQAILLTDDVELADQVVGEVERQLEDLPRAATARASWQGEGAVILAPAERFAEIVDRFAPEHLELMVADPETLSRQIKRAGAIFLGHYTPEVIGDYVGGPNHVLPTNRSARFSSGLSVFDFMTRTTLLSCDAEAFKQLGPAARRLATEEGLIGHARAAAYRLEPSA